MLTLIKFDLKNTWFKIFVYCIAIMLCTVFTIYFWSNIFEGFFNDNNFYWITIFRLGSLGVSGAVCFICLIMVFVTLAQWFAQNLMADEGHFMNMLPVSKLKLFSSKVFTAAMWNVVLVGFSLLCLFVFMLFGSRLVQVNDIIADLSGTEGEKIHIGYLFVLFGVFLALHAITVSILSYVSICLGHMVNYGKNIVVLLGFIGLGLAEIIIGIFVAYVMGVFNFENLSSITGMIVFFKSFCIKMSVVSIINSVITFALGVHLLNGGLNID